MKFKQKSTQPIQLGIDLLSPVSQAATADAINEQISYIDMDMIVPNKLNDFSMEAINQLAELIVMSEGILQPLILKPEKNKEGKYVLTTGERRWRAAKLLREEGRYPEKYKNKVPCIFRSPESLEMNLSQENKEKFSILVTNQTREKTDGDKMREFQYWQEIFSELRKNGEKEIPESLAAFAGVAKYDEKGEYIPERLKGEKTKNLVMKYGDISSGEYARMKKIENNASPSIMEKIMGNEMSLSAAQEVMEMPEKEQERFLEEKKGKSIDIKAARERAEEIGEKITLEKKQILQELKKLQDDIPEKLELSSKQHQKYVNYIKQLKNLLKD